MISLFDNTTKAGTASGTLLTIFVNINSADVLKTIILAGIGAVVSFLVTVGLKYLYRLIKRK